MVVYCDHGDKPWRKLKCNIRRETRMRYLALLLSVLLYHQTTLAQLDPWERVKLIEPGKKVQVKLRSGKTLNGDMENWTADGLSVRQGENKVVPVAKADVARVAMVTGMSRGRRAGYAALISGGAVGGLFGLACATSDCSGEASVYVLAALIIVAGFTAAVAAGIAALFPQHKEVIYSAVPVSTNSAR